jgi:hypothetical protein
MKSSNFKGEYPPDWPQIAERIKAKHNYCCERCHHPNDSKSGHTLTVHHLDGNKSNCADWNLAALCQRCHLHIQGIVNMFQFYMFTHSDWFTPHLAGFYQSLGVKFENYTGSTGNGAEDAG